MCENLAHLSFESGPGSSVGRARVFWSEGGGFDPGPEHPFPIGLIGVSIM